MKFQTILFLCCVVLMGTYSCTPPEPTAPPAPDLAKVKAEIQALEDAYAAGMKAKDVDAIVAYYADDAVNMPHDEPEAVGKATIIERIKTSMEKDTTAGGSTVFEVMDIMAAGDKVIEVGKSTSTDAEGKVTTGKYISIFEKRDGKYVCIRDIWNNDAPKDSDIVANESMD